jgi:hypothetical protein
LRSRDPWARTRAGRPICASPQFLVLEGKWGRFQIPCGAVADLRIKGPS